MKDEGTIHSSQPLCQTGVEKKEAHIVFILPPLSGSSHTQSVGNAIDIIKKRGNEIYLQDCLIVEAMTAQGFYIFAPHVGGRESEFGGVVEHGKVGGRKTGLLIIGFNLRGQRIIARSDTQKLRVRFRSIKAVIERGNGCSNHFVLRSRQGQIRLKQAAEQGKGMIERVRYQGVGLADAPARFRRGQYFQRGHFPCVFRRILRHRAECLL